MNGLLLLSAALATGLAIAHSVLGERYLLVRLFRRDDLPRLFGGQAFTVGTLRFAWHLTSVAWLGLAVLLVLAALDGLDRRSVLVTLGVTFLVSALLPLGWTRGRHLAWLPLATIGGIALLCAGRP
ncbi:MAG: hypothetical protein KF823_02515 [Xanthomonadales bacterium]|nr:hypothetical protein [Xanthomonadales bacterium]